MAEATEPTTGITGFFQPKYSNGTWALRTGSNGLGDECDTCLVATPGRDGEFYEESAWSYSWFVPHDYAQLIQLVGGPENFTDRLGTSVNAKLDLMSRYIL